MKKVLLLVFVSCSAPLFAQQREVKVQLFSTQAITSARIVPRGAAAIDGTVLKVPAVISAVSGQVAVHGKKASARTVRVSGTFALETPGNTSVRLQNNLEIRVDGNRLQFVTSEPLESYVAAVLAGEASTFRSMESLKAMAVAVRTFAVRFGGRHRREGFDFCDTTHCQDFRVTAVTDRLKAAVESTEGEILWFEGKPAATYYHQDCGGHTEDSSSVWADTREPYLRGQSDSFCLAKGRLGWSTELTPAELRQAIGATSVEILSRTRTGRVRQLRLSGGKTALVSAEVFRLSIGRVLGWNRLRSDHYEILQTGGKLQFQGYGAGHGVGLCQAGAAQMGENGRSYRDILAFYYPETRLGITAQGLSWTRASGERVELQSTRLDADRRIIAVGDRLLRQAEEQTGRRLEARPAIRVFPSVSTFRDSTGEPGWIAASTRGNTIRLQPLETLGATTEKTLHHELLHLLIEQYAAPTVPRWFREGLALVLSNSDTATAGQMRNPTDIDRALLRPGTREEFAAAYAGAKALAGQLITKHGRRTVLGWLETGLPVNLGLMGASSLPQR